MVRIGSTLCLLLLGACATSSGGIPPGEHVGEPVQEQKVHKLSEVQAKPESYFEQTLLVEANVVAVCQSKGCWMQIEDGGEKAMVRWETGCGGKYAFPSDAEGERILIQGSFYPKEIAQKDIEHLEAEAGKDVTIPAKTYEMNASAVVMLDRK